MNAAFSTITADDARRYIATARLTPNAVALRIRQVIRPTMRSECAWCGKHLGDVPCKITQCGETTHGICNSCAETQLGVSVGETAAAGNTVRGSGDKPAAAQISSCGPWSSLRPSDAAKDSHEGALGLRPEQPQ